ncbi:MAG TPA: M20/M25/M40 family metallo-hydrolase [Anaerolineales bacterium]|nr:M20/M25/M40 family metallo-hydrolase [Anaerolineales bacterium]HLF01712.1 M20/M25/M40 family metallo-hydrolase [Anaerolineales bacterium]
MNIIETAAVVERAIAIQQIPAPTFEESQRAKYIAREFAALGLRDVTIDEMGNVFACRPGGPATPTLVTAHTDTVFPGDVDLTIHRAGDRVYGPGIGDNSLGVAGLFALVETLNVTRIDTPGDLWLAANVGEEGLGDLRGMRAVTKRFGERVRATIIIEGMAYGHVYHRAIGVHRLRIMAQAEGGHSWHDFGRPSAVHGLTRLAARLTALPLSVEPKTTLNIGQISGGTSVNTIAREASLELDLRSEDPSALSDLVDQVLNLTYESNAPGLSISHIVTSQRPAGAIAVDQPLVQMVAGVLRELGCEPIFERGSTDANIPLSLGLPAIVIGLCHGGNAHRPDEYIETAMIENGVKQLVKVVLGTYQL